MRPTLALLALLACGVAPSLAPVPARASVRLHLPHGHRHKHRAQPATSDAPAPTSDVPDAIWTSTKSHR